MTNTKTSTVQTFTIPADGLNAAKLGRYAGDALEVLAAACDFSAYEECRENNFDYFSVSITQGLKEYDFEDALLDALNDAPDRAAQAVLLEQAGEDAQEYAPILAAYSKPGQPLKLGAFIALEYPASWSAMVSYWSDTQKDIVYECLGGYADRPGLYPPLAKTLDDWMGTLEDELMREYLQGDRSDIGLEQTAARKYGLEDVTYHRKYGTIAVTYDTESEELREAIPAYKNALADAEIDEYDKDDEEKRERVAASLNWPAAITGFIEYHASANIEKEKRKSEERRAEREKTTAYQKERREAAEAERIAKLRAMTK